MNNGEERCLKGEEDDDEDDLDGEGREAWERTYADERSWESLQEDESGLLCPIDNKILLMQGVERASLLHALNADNSSALIVIFIFMRACIITHVGFRSVRV